MPEIAHITYEQNNTRIPDSDNLGMRVMQRKVYDRRNEKYLLLKAPPASGKSRACMYIALDKLAFQGIKKVIISVPEKTIASSFKNTDLRSGGFFTDWQMDDDYNLCTGGSDYSQRKITKFKAFLSDPGAKILLCTHSTLRYAYADISDVSLFDNCFVCIDEFHHTSADVDNSRLGEMVADIVQNSTAHMLAMTGSYFRGDGIAVLSPEIEKLFTSVTYTYYEQLSSYKYLNTISLSYDFYSGTYFSMLKKDLDVNRKTIIYIPNVNSNESTKDKYDETDRIIDVIGDVESEDEYGVYLVRTAEGDLLRVIDLVDDSAKRITRMNYIADNVDNPDAIDIIISLNLAKEGFDWPACSHTLVLGYRNSLTEIVQIIGRCTRDFPGKKEAWFTNIIAEPDATAPETAEAVNNLLKAITASLLMEQVLVPKWDFKVKAPKLKLLSPESNKAKDIIDNQMTDLLEAIMTNPDVQKMIVKKNSAKLINKGLVPKIIVEKYPDLSQHDREAIRQHAVTQMVINSANSHSSSDGSEPSKKLLRFADGMTLIIKDLDINLIDSINPFEQAYQVLAKAIDRNTLASIRDVIDRQMGRRRQFTQTEIDIYAPLAVEFSEEQGRLPDRFSDDPYEKTLGDLLLFIKEARESQR